MQTADRLEENLNKSVEWKNNNCKIMLMEESGGKKHRLAAVNTRVCKSTAVGINIKDSDSVTF